MARKKNKVYAIFYADSRTKEIVDSWDECKQKIVGVPHLLHGFQTEQEADDWLNRIKESEIQRALMY